jgi:hypothetical protein
MKGHSIFLEFTAILAWATGRNRLFCDIDVMQFLQIFDAGGRARAANAVVQLLAQAKEVGVVPDQALALVNWEM